jgi:hypothetical protein
MSRTPLPEQIRTYSEALVADLPEPAIRRIASDRPSPRPRGWVVVAAAAAVVLVLGLVPLVLLSGGDTPTVEPSTTVPTTPPTTPPPTTSIAPQAPDAGALPPIQASRLSPVFVEASAAGRVYRVETAIGTLRFTVACSGRPDLFPTCTHEPAAPQDTAIRDLVATVAAPGGGFAALEWTHDPEGDSTATVLFSFDGRTWEPTLALDDPSWRGYTLSVVDDVLWVTGAWWPEWPISVWRSSDGRNWERATEVIDALPDTLAAGSLDEPVASGGTLIFAGTAWTSDGRPLVDWFQIAGLDPEGDLGLEAVWAPATETITLRSYPDRVELDEPDFALVGRYRISIDRTGTPVLQVRDAANGAIVQAHPVPEWVAAEVEDYLPQVPSGQDLSFIEYGEGRQFLAVTDDGESFEVVVPPWSRDALTRPATRLRNEDGRFVATVERHFGGPPIVETWVSADGRAWSRADDVLPEAPRPYRAMWHAPSGTFLGFRNSIVYASDDGMSWEPAGRVAAGPHGSDLRPFPPYGFLTVSEAANALGYILHLSGDGQTWQSVDLTDLLEDVSPCPGRIVEPVGSTASELWLFGRTGADDEPGLTCSLTVRLDD